MLVESSSPATSRKEENPVKTKDFIVLGQLLAMVLSTSACSYSQLNPQEALPRRASESLQKVEVKKGQQLQTIHDKEIAEALSKLGARQEGLQTDGSVALCEQLALNLSPQDESVRAVMKWEAMDQADNFSGITHYGWSGRWLCARFYPQND